MARYGKTHGMTKTRVYQAWLHMKQRCYDPNTPKYHLYGGRGISVCKQWLHSFERFFADMGERPSPRHSLDRRNPNGNYTPKNCRWATYEEQRENRRDCVHITYAGRSQLISTWARELGMGPVTLAHRLKCGWSVERAFTTPVRPITRSPVTEG